MNTPEETPKAPRAPREKPEPAAITQDQVLRVFADNPTKVIAYRQLSRRLGVTAKTQREEIFAHIKVLRKNGLITLLQNDEYRLADTDAVAAALMPSSARKSGKKEALPVAPPRNRSVQAEFGQDPIVHRRRSAGFDYVDGDDRPERAPSNTVIGTVDLATPNFAFVVPEGTGEADDIRVFTDQLKFALQGDVVRVRMRSSRDGRPVGDVVEVLKRVRPEIVGRIQIQGTLGFVKPDNRKVYFDVFVPPHLLHESRNGDKVLVRINEFPEDSSRQPVGEVIRNFGAAGGNEAEINAIMAEFGLPFEFPEEVQTESEGISEVIAEDEIARRRDFRNVTTFTIDPADAKDFDDALSIEKLQNGHWEIGVHIADVTHYVRPGTELEREGKHRATSVYLVDRVIPMLPELLSNGLCSLRPH